MLQVGHFYRDYSPEPVEAVEFDGTYDQAKAILAWVPEAQILVGVEGLEIRVPGAEFPARRGDVIVRELDGTADVSSATDFGIHFAAVD